MSFTTSSSMYASNAGSRARLPNDVTTQIVPCSNLTFAHMWHFAPQKRDKSDHQLSCLLVCLLSRPHDLKGCRRITSSAPSDKLLLSPESPSHTARSASSLTSKHNTMPFYRLSDFQSRSKTSRVGITKSSPLAMFAKAPIRLRSASQMA